MAASEFSKAVELGLKLSKRIYYGKDAAVVPPSAPPRTVSMTSDRASMTSDFEYIYLPTAVMAYAEICDPRVVDNPDVPSYQPYVHGRCLPPALIPLHMNKLDMTVECCLDTAFVTVSGAWRVHCVAASERCGCRIAVPMGEQGSVLGVEVEIPSKSYSTELVSLESPEDADKVANSKDGFLIKGHIYTLKIPRVNGGTVISIKVHWSQKLLYQDGQFCLNVPFNFPSYVNPVGRNLSKKEVIRVKVNSVTRTEVLYQSLNHPLKRVGENSREVEFLCEREASIWSISDLNFSYDVSSDDIVCGLLLQSPSFHDYDRREKFCLYMYPGKSLRKAFRKEVIFLIDISASMQGSALENVKTVLLAALSKLNPEDAFNIIALNEDSLKFSSSLAPANKEMIDKACEWIQMNFKAEGGTNISAPVKQALNMFTKTGDLVPLIFLVTDGAVEDEKDLCDFVKDHLAKGGLPSPRIFTFGIGLYCNHYFLQMLAQIGRGNYEAALDIDSINSRLERFVSRALSIILADITVNAFNFVDSLEICPIHIPDLSSESPLLISGRYYGNFPDSVEIYGTSADLNNFTMNVEVKRSNDAPFDQVFTRREIDSFTAHAWHSGSKQLQEKATKLSLRAGVPCEYTSMILVETDKSKFACKLNAETEQKTPDFKGLENILFLRSLSTGFGDIKATVENRRPEQAEPKLYETSEMLLRAATDLVRRTMDRFCCMCFLRFCTKLNDECAIVATQICTLLACCECVNVCYDICICE